MSQPKVSIIVPVYNVEKYLERCIKSLRNQTLKDIEIILVNDSSTDSSLEICQRAALEDPRIKLINKEKNEGLGITRNAGLEIATGEFVGFVDSDDFVELDMFRMLYAKAAEYDSDLVISGFLFVGGNIFSKAGGCVRETYFDEDTHFDTAESLKELRMGVVGAMPEDADDSKYGRSVCKNLFRRKIINQNNIAFQSEREVPSEDVLFMIDYISCIKKAIGIDEAFYYYCRNEGSISKSYKKDRFEKYLVFVSEVEKRLKKDIEPREYQIYLDRFWQAICRVLCSQEIMYAKDNNIKYADLKKRLQAVCTHSLTVKVLKSYPIGNLPFKQRVFAYGMKYRLYFLLIVLVRLRSE